MSSPLRAYFGAVLGALLTLLLHPTSRPYLLGPLVSWGPSPALTNSRWLPESQVVLPLPTDTALASLWMGSASDSLARRSKVPREDLEKVLAVATRGAQMEPENAYWLQMAALLHRELGNEEQAIKEWIRASRRARWNDLQTSRLLRVRQEMAAEYGAVQSWQLATVFSLRSLAGVHMLQVLSRWMLTKAAEAPDGGLAIRFACLMNGKLIRDGGRSVSLGSSGVEIMEAASYPANYGPKGSQKRLLLARYGLVNALRDRQMLEESVQTDRAYRTSDAWMAFTQSEEREDWLQFLTKASLAVATVPSTLLLVGFIGGILWAGGTLTARFKVLQLAFQPPVAPVLGILFALAIYFSTSLALASIAVVLCFAFLAFTPAKERSRPSSDLGPMFRLTIVVLALALTFTTAGFIVGASTPGTLLLPQVGVPEDYVNGSTLFLGLGGIVLGLLLLTAPTWALVQHIPTPSVVTIVLRQFGSMLCSFALGLAVVLTPAGIFVDRELSETLRMLVENEPNYYLLQR